MPAPPSAGAAVAAPLPTAAEALPAQALSFYVVDQGLTQEVKLRRIENATVAVLGWDAWRVGGAGLERPEKLGSSVIPPGFLEDVVGSWPGPLWASAARSTGSSGCGELFRGVNGGWSHFRTHLAVTHTYFGIGPWKDGSVLALRGTLDVQPKFTFELVSGKGRPLPQLSAPGSVADPEGSCKKWGMLGVPRQMVSLASGHVFVLGRACNDQAATAETWAPGEARGTVELLENSGGLWPVRLLARSGDDVYALLDGLGGAPNPDSVIFHFDGKRWTRQVFDASVHLMDGDLAPDGTLFVIGAELDAMHNHKAGRLWRREADGKFRELGLPARDTPEPWAVYSVSAMSKDDVWIAASDSLLHSVAPTEPPRRIELPKPEPQYSPDVCAGGRR